ncbi:hypothetical protein ACLQ3B_23415 [Micromonospora sp. DT53]|uniref:hypothetical protein n=1 Tax=Micromonospora sp. DT53 TaxID=3393444 RepID=UPI003CE88356
MTTVTNAADHATPADARRRGRGPARVSTIDKDVIYQGGKHHTYAGPTMINIVD